MTPIRSQYTADELHRWLHDLDVPDALAALLEAQAMVLAEHGVTPGTQAFDGLMELHERVLPARVRRLQRERMASAN
jgi:hypothetical protein